MMNILICICVCIAAYLVGSLSPSFLIAKLKGIEITKEGSGNAGATNSFRVLGKKLGACVFLLDFLKGFAVVFISALIFGEIISYCAFIAVVVGHVFSVYHKFCAGKGVSTSIGSIFAINWILGIIVFVFGILLVIATRRVSIGSLSAALVLPIAAWFIQPGFFFFSLAITAILFFSHRKNIIRLVKGKEKPLW